MELDEDKEIKQITETKNNIINLDEINEKDINQKYLGFILTTKKWRVKLYRLNERGQWDDCGIGFVFCINNQDDKEKIINKLIMTNELTEEEMINIIIDKNTAEFHNQRGTIMTWKTGDDDKGDDNIAMSFQEKEGIIEIMKNIFLCEGKNINDGSLLMDNQSETCYEISIQNLPNLSRELTFDMGEQKLVNFMNYLKNNNYEFIIQLGELLKEEEKKVENLKTTTSTNVTNTNINSNINISTVKNNDIIQEKINDEKNNEYNQQQIYKSFPMENISFIFTIVKNLILMADKDLIKLLMKDEYYLITFGALEYDFETMKTVPHRKYFHNIVKFKNP